MLDLKMLARSLFLVSAIGAKMKNIFMLITLPMLIGCSTISNYFHPPHETTYYKPNKTIILQDENGNDDAIIRQYWRSSGAGYDTVEDVGKSTVKIQKRY